MGGRSQGRVVAVTLVGKSIACRYPMAYNGIQPQRGDRLDRAPGGEGGPTQKTLQSCENTTPNEPGKKEHMMQIIMKALSP